MGASFDTMTLDGKLDAQAVKREFSNHQSQCAMEDGNSYSGRLNMCSGLTFSPGVLPDQNTANEQICEAAQKWGPALAVKYKDTKTELVKKPTFNGKERANHAWFRVGRGHNVHSMKSVSPVRDRGSDALFIVADQLTDNQKQRLTKATLLYLEAKKVASNLSTLFGELKEQLAKVDEPFTEYQKLKTTRNKLTKALAKDAKLYESLKKLDEQFSKRLYKEKTVDLGVRWFIGGWCSS